MVKKMPIIISTLALLGGLTPVSSCFADSFDYDEVYNSGYNNGTIDGYWEGYEHGRANGYNEGYRDGYDFGLSSGYEEGYSNGHSSGYYDGYNNGLANDRYDIGYSDGLNSGLNTGYANGRNDGFSNGYDAGYQVGYQDGYNNSIATTFQDTEETDTRAIDANDTAIIDNTTAMPEDETTAIDSLTVATTATADNTSETNIVNPVVVSNTVAKKPAITAISAPDTGAPTEENHSIEFPWWAIITIAISGFLAVWWLMPIKKSKKSKKA